MARRQSRRDSEDYDAIYKIIIIGDSGVGKSNILTRYLKNEFKIDSKSTVGVEFGSKKLTIKGTKIKCQIWDTAGEERYRSITSTYYKGSKGCFLVYDITSESSFENIDKWYGEIKKAADKNISVILVGNKCDLEQERQVPAEKGEQKAKTLNCPFFETSALAGIQIERAFTTMVENIHDASNNTDTGSDGEDYDIIKNPGEATDLNEKKKGCC